MISLEDYYKLKFNFNFISWVLKDQISWQTVLYYVFYVTNIFQHLYSNVDNSQLCWLLVHSLLLSIIINPILCGNIKIIFSQKKLLNHNKIGWKDWFVCLTILYSLTHKFNNHNLKLYLSCLFSANKIDTSNVKCRNAKFLSQKGQVLLYVQRACKS